MGLNQPAPLRLLTWLRWRNHSKSPLRPQRAQDQPDSNSHRNLKEPVKRDNPSAVAGHEHHDCKSDAGVSVCITFQPERNEDDSQDQDADAEHQSMPGYQAPANAPAPAPNAVPATRCAETGSVAPRVDCITTSVAIAAHQDSGKAHQRATKSETTAAIAVRAECSIVNGLFLSMIGRSIDPIAQRTCRSNTITKSTAGR